MPPEPLFPIEEDIGVGPGASDRRVSRLKSFLGAFAPPPVEEAPDLFDAQAEADLRRYQRSNNLDETGTLTPETFSHFKRPHCTSLDIRHFARYSVDGNPWGRNDLTYSVDDQTGEHFKETYASAVVDAFGAWQAALNGQVRFQPAAEGTAGDIQIIFYLEQPHSQGNDMIFGWEGRQKKVLAHAFYPIPPNEAHNLKGHVHVNGLAPWLGRPGGRYNLTSALMHEIGHALGLPHSTLCDSIMYSVYNDDNDELSDSDKQMIRALYLEGASVALPSIYEDRGGGSTAELSTALIVPG